MTAHRVGGMDSGVADETSHPTVDQGLATSPLTIFTPAFWQNPWPVLDDLRRRRPVCPVIHPGGYRTWFVTRYEDVRTLLADPRLSKDMTVGTHLYDGLIVDPGQRAERAARKAKPRTAPSLHGHMLDSDPPTHTRRRKQLAGVFTSRRIEALRPRVVALVEEIFDRLDDNAPVDLMSTVAFPVPFTVIAWLLGVPPEDHVALRGWSTLILSGPSTPEVDEAERSLGTYLDDLIRRRTAQPDDGLLSAMITTVGTSNGLRRSELVPMAYLLLSAGHETTVSLIGNGLATLLTHHEQLAALRADPGLWAPAIEEMMRVDPPLAHSSWRFTTEPVTVGDVTIPAGEFVTMSLSAVGRDPQRWDRPDAVDLARPDVGHLSFGGGIHYCIGAPLARMEAEVVFSTLLARFPGARLAVDPADLTWRPGWAVRALDRLPALLA